MTHAIVPTTQLGDRMPEAGRIRLGIKSGNAMKSIKTFRFTSPSEKVIGQIAERYGAKVGPRPWNDPRASPSEQFEVITASSEIRIFLPPDSLSVWYEQWTGGGCARRCDGVQVTIAGRNQPDIVPCICAQPKPNHPDGVMECKPYTRLNVILPDVDFLGTWRLETKGWNAAHEMPGMAAMIEQLHTRGLAEAKLRLDQESQMQGGKKKHFVVPRLLIAETPQAMLTGGAQVALMAGGQAALPAATPEADQLEHTAPLDVPTPGTRPQVEETDWFDQDDEIVDAEIVDEEPSVGAPVEGNETSPLDFVHYCPAGGSIACKADGSNTPEISTVNCPDCLSLHKMAAEMGAVEQDLVHLVDDQGALCFVTGEFKSTAGLDDVTCPQCVAEWTHRNANTGQPAGRAKAVAKRTSKNPVLTKFVLTTEKVADNLIAAGALEPTPDVPFKDEVRHAFAWWASGKTTESSTKLSKEAMDKAITGAEKCVDNLAQAAKVLTAYRGRPM